MAGQNSVWKVTMSLPMKWYCSVSGAAMYSSKLRVSQCLSLGPPLSNQFLSEAR